jgi:hypothetical protein
MNSAWALNLSSLPTPKTSLESIQQWDVRKKQILEELASKPLPPFDSKANAMRFVEYSIARLALHHGVEEVNQILLDPNTRAFAEVGTDWHSFGRICARNGDYDFVLRDLTLLYHLFGNNPRLIYPETKRKLLDVLFTAKGNEPITQVKLGICGKRPETENHILMTESARLQINQFILDDLRSQGRYDEAFDNEKNGMNEWMLKHLQDFAKHGYSEYNSKPYEIHSMMAIHNLFEVSNSDRIRTAARILLDSSAAKYIATSLRNRRVVPFRRRKEFWNNPFKLR